MDNPTFLAAVTLLVMFAGALLYSVMVFLIERGNPRRVARRHVIPPLRGEIASPSRCAGGGGVKASIVSDPSNK